MAKTKYDVDWRGFQTNEGPLDINNALEIYRDYDGRIATLILARHGAELKGDTSLVRFSRHVPARALYLTDEMSVDEWPGD